MNQQTIDRVFDDNSEFYKKLNEWYGKRLDDTQVNVYSVDEVDGVLATVIFVLKEKEKVEIARVFTIFGNTEISIDLQTNINSLGGIKKLIQYGETCKK